MIHQGTEYDRDSVGHAFVLLWVSLRKDLQAQRNIKRQLYQRPVVEMTKAHAYNTSCHESARYTPFELMFGRKCVLAIDIEEC